MSLKEFRANLFKNSKSLGGQWHKVDFHVHTHASTDYEYSEPDAAQQLGKALDGGDYASAVVLQHDNLPAPATLGDIQKHCPNTTLVPGAEINVFVDALSKKVSKDYYFHCVLAVDPAQGNDYSYLLRQAKERFTYRQDGDSSGFRSSIIDLGRFFVEQRAIFIPAHLHQSKSPEESRSIDDIYEDDAFLDFVSADVFTALEVRDVRTAAFFDGLHRTAGDSVIPSAVCVRSSDAHHHRHIVERNRATWVQAENRTFDELAAALSFKHRVALEEPHHGHTRVLGLHITGAFFSDEWIALNGSMSALIGCKGSGKTAVLECLRFALGTQVPRDRVDSVKAHLAHILGPAGYVECLVARTDGSQTLLTRRADAPDRITVTEENGETRTVANSDAIGFTASILGWHEIEAIADHAQARVELVDRIGIGAEVGSQYQAICSNIERARDQLPILQRVTKNLDNSLRELWELQSKREALHRLEEGDLLQLQRQYEWYLLTEQKLTSLKADVEKRRLNLPALMSSKLSLSVQPEGMPESLSPRMQQIADKLTSLADAERTATTEVEAALTAIEAELEVAMRDIQQDFLEFQGSVYRPKVDALPATDRDILTRQIQILEETKELPTAEAKCADLLREVKASAEEMYVICDGICSARQNVIRIREAEVERLNGELPSVRLSFLRSGNHQARELFKKRYGAEASQLINLVQQFGQQEAYQNLRQFFDKLRKIDLTKDKWELDALFWDIRFLDLLSVIDDDDIQVSLEAGRAGFVPIQKLSSGQRCTAIFPLLLRNTRGPLIIDQPEDNLDNRHIADVIAPDLLRRKSDQQFVFTSHNANLVVLTDADLIVHTDSDGSTGLVVGRGFLSCASSPIRTAVLNVLDGGEEALLARQRKYGQVRN
ncbi:MAG: AAA family ATPase [bacterium]